MSHSDAFEVEESVFRPGNKSTKRQARLRIPSVGRAHRCVTKKEKTLIERSTLTRVSRSTPPSIRVFSPLAERRMMMRAKHTRKKRRKE